MVVFNLLQNLMKMTSSMLLVLCALVSLSMAAVAPPLKDDNVSVQHRNVLIFGSSFSDKLKKYFHKILK